MVIIFPDAYAINATLNLFSLSHLLLSRLLMVMSCQGKKAVFSHRQGKKIVTGGCSTSPSASNNVSSKAGPSSLGAPGVYFLGWNLPPKSLLSEQGSATEWCHHAFPSTTLEALNALSNGG